MNGSKPRVAFLISGRGSNMAAIIHKIRKKRLKAAVALVFSDRIGAPGLEIARKFGYETQSFSPRDFASPVEHDRELVRLLQKKRTDWVVCAGYLRILQKPMLDAFKNRIVNIHPSLLPAFPGLRAQKQALDQGVKFTGCTVHFVDEGIDTGPIIAQRVVKIQKNETEVSLSRKILKEEHDLYWRTLKEIF